MRLPPLPVERGPDVALTFIGLLLRQQPFDEEAARIGRGSLHESLEPLPQRSGIAGDGGEAQDVEEAEEEGVVVGEDAEEGAGVEGGLDSEEKVAF